MNISFGMGDRKLGKNRTCLRRGLICAIPKLIPRRSMRKRLFLIECRVLCVGL